VHVPSHIYARVGPYGDAVEANLRATKADVMNPPIVWSDARFEEAQERSRELEVHTTTAPIVLRR
jgi:hypothetical protein